MKVALYASGSKAENVGRLSHRKSVQVYEDKNFTLPLGKLRERFVDSIPDFP